MVFKPFNMILGAFASHLLSQKKEFMDAGVKHINVCICFHAYTNLKKTVIAKPRAGA